MLDKTFLQCFDAVVKSTREDTVCRYLEEARRCFAAEAYNGAVVMTWNAVACYLRQVVEAIGVALFRYNYYAMQAEEPPIELWRINDSLMIQTCKRMGILPGVLQGLDDLRIFRNSCAHPTGVFASDKEAVEFVENIYGCVSRSVNDERLAGIAVVLEFIKMTGEQDGKAIARWVKEDLRLQLAHDLLTIYLSDDADIEDASGIIGLWRELWSEIEDLRKGSLWNRLESAVREVLEAAANEELTPRTPEELIQLIVWPRPDAMCEPRDRIGALYVEWFESRVQRNILRGADMDLARNLRHDLPDSFRNRLQIVLQEMGRRMIE